MRWVKKQQGYLAWWADQLKGRNLRKLTLLDDILPALEGQKARGHRIAVLKRVYSYLRKVKHVLTVAEDPTFGRLSVPQAKPELWKRAKAIPREHYLLAREHLAGHWRDALDILAGTGWHVSELQRFAEDGRVEPYPCQGDVEGVAGVLICPSHKNGEELRTGASAEVVDAARRLRERGSLSIEKFGLAVGRRWRSLATGPVRTESVQTCPREMGERGHADKRQGITPGSRFRPRLHPGRSRAPHRGPCRNPGVRPA